MRVADEKLAEIWDNGFTVIENFIDKESLAAAREALWTIHPRPEDYFADPSKHEKYAKSQFAGIQLFPFEKWELSRLAVYPDLIDMAERFLQTKEIDLYKSELWAKYSGAINYDQFHHRDYRNHTIVVPREDGFGTQMTTFLLLSDVGPNDGPTKVVPAPHTREVPMGTARTKFGTYFDKEVSIEAPAGSLMVYKTDVFHRGSNFGAPGRARFAILTDFKARGRQWQGKLAWPDHAEKAVWDEAMAKMTPRQRDLFGFPPAGSEYWNAQTLRDVQVRYPEMDMTPYREGVAA
jgi:ectoine hydroxylase-related dioxygenase (phytanoyl-CoA dioxygenase family)